MFNQNVIKPQVEMKILSKVFFHSFEVKAHLANKFETQRENHEKHLEDKMIKD